MSSVTVTPLNSFTVIEFFGEKALPFLQGQVTCDMRQLTTHGTHAFGALCDHRGRMLANFWIVNWQNNFLMILPSDLSQTIEAHLKKYAVFSKVVITLSNKFFIAELMHYSDENLSGIFIPLPSEKRYLYLNDHNALTNYSINTDETDWQKRNIQDQLAILYPQTSLLFTPQMIALEKHGGISFDKGCYVGQEIVARTQYLGTLKRHLHRLTLQSESPFNPGDEIKNTQGEAIGVIIESVKHHNDTYDVLAVIQDAAVDSLIH